MNEENVRELLGRYATGALTEKERALLFEAALADQSVFEELGNEHELKALLDQPGARERMVASLRPRGRETRRIWAWTAGVAGAAAIAGVIAIAVLREQPSTQISEVRTFNPPPVSIPATPLIESPPPALTASREQSAKSAPVVPSALSITGSLPPPSASQADESVKKLATPNAGAPGIAAAGFRAINQSVAAPPATGFAFTYAVTQNGKLQVVPASAGYLTIRAGNGASSRSLAENLAVQPQVVSEFEVPSEASIVTVIFSAQRISPDDLKSDSAGAADAPSGFKFDPNPSPVSRLTAIFPFNPPRR